MVVLSLPSPLSQFRRFWSGLFVPFIVFAFKGLVLGFCSHAVRVCELHVHITALRCASWRLCANYRAACIKPMKASVGGQV